MKTKKIAITGGFGFIGSSLIHFLNKKGFTDIDIYENEECFSRWINVKNLSYSSVIIDNDFLLFNINDYDCIIHLGAHTQTNLQATKENYENNFSYTKKLISKKSYHTTLIFASSASVYGNPSDGDFSEKTFDLYPQNFYAFTKLECDKFIEKFNNPNVYSLRFFNVYGANEKHKLSNNMCSPIYKWINQEVTIDNPITILENESLKLERDFVYVDDVCEVIFHCMASGGKGGIYNVGNGESYKWKEVAKKICSIRQIDENHILYKPFELHKFNGYQTYTKANLYKLREVLEYKKDFTNLDLGIQKTIERIMQNK